MHGRAANLVLTSHRYDNQAVSSARWAIILIYTKRSLGISLASSACKTRIPGGHGQHCVGVVTAFLNRQPAQKGVVLGHQEERRGGDVGDVMLTGPVLVVILHAVIPAAPNPQLASVPALLFLNLTVYAPLAGATSEMHCPSMCQSSERQLKPFFLKKAAIPRQAS